MQVSRVICPPFIIEKLCSIKMGVGQATYLQELYKSVYSRAK
jgi:hypothetical protein